MQLAAAQEFRSIKTSLWAGILARYYLVLQDPTSSLIFSLIAVASAPNDRYPVSHGFSGKDLFRLAMIFPEATLLYVLITQALTLMVVAEMLYFKCREHRTKMILPSCKADALLL